MAEYKLIGSFAADRASVKRAMDDPSLTREQKQDLIDRHNKMNLDELTLPPNQTDIALTNTSCPRTFPYRPQTPINTASDLLSRIR